MVYTVYIDLLLILDFIIDYLILYATGKISGVTIRRRRLAVSALTGAVFSVVTIVWTPIISPLFMLCAGYVMVGISYGFKRWRLFLVFLFVSAAFGGVVFALDCISGGNLSISVRTLARATAICYLILSVVFRKSAVGTTKKEQVRVEIETDEGKTFINALVDSGNSLCDPATNMPVMVAELSAVKELFCKDTYKNISDNTAEDAVVKAGRGFLLIPFKTLGGSGMLLAFKPEKVLVEGKRRNLLVAISKSRLSEGVGYEGIIGLEE